jgi:peroxiredoxin
MSGPVSDCRTGGLLVLAIVLVAVLPVGGQQPPPEPGQAAPDFSLETLTRNVVRLSDYRGHPVLINFWASWCEPCREEMPALVAAFDEHRGHGFEILAVNLRDQEREKEVRAFVTEFRLPFPVLLDKRGKVRKRYDLIAVPTTVFVDSAGVVRVVHPGPLTAEALAGGLGSILSTP